MKKLLFYLMLLVGLNAFAQPQTNIQDAAFENYLETHNAAGGIVALGSSTSMGNGIPNDYFVLTSRISGVTNLNVGGRSISNLSGIQDFTSLQYLGCFNNNISNLNLVGLNNLNNLECNNNQISNLNLSGLYNLVEIDCGYNLLTSLNVSGFYNLINLHCENNLLTNLNLNGAIQLDFLSCDDNKLHDANIFSGLVNLDVVYASTNEFTSINLTTLLNLSYLDISHSFLTSLNVNGLTNLGFLNCGYNQLNNLNVSNLVNLTYLVCESNQLECLDITNANLSVFLVCNNNPNLSCIKVSNVTLANSQTNWYKDSFASYSSTCPTCLSVTSKVQNSQCGITLATIDTAVFADIPNAPVTGYKFRIVKLIAGVPSTNPADSQIFQPISTSSPNRFYFTQLIYYAYNTSYQIEVSIEHLGVWQPYGIACTVTTPNIFTKIRASQCGSTLTCKNERIFADLVGFVTGYRFSVINLTDPTNILTPQDTLLRELNMDLFSSPCALYGSTYEVRVAVKNYDGTYTNYGSPCFITMPPFPTTKIRSSQCNSTITNRNLMIYADLIPCAAVTKYRFRLTNGLGYNQTVDNSTRAFRLSQFSGLLTNTTYFVEVSVQICGVFGPYGPICSASTLRIAPDKKNDMNMVNDFNVVSYPNPTNDSFLFEITSESKEKIELKVYDMIGRQIETKIISFDAISSTYIGANYPTGVYNIIITQGEHLKMVKVIKR